MKIVEISFANPIDKITIRGKINALAPDLASRRPSNAREPGIPR